jgi:hypothetical protein
MTGKNREDSKNNWKLMEKEKKNNSILTQFPAKMANSYLVQQHFSLMASGQLTEYLIV